RRGRLSRIAPGPPPPSAAQSAAFADHRVDVAVAVPVRTGLHPGGPRLPQDLRVVRGPEDRAAAAVARVLDLVVEVALLVPALRQLAQRGSPPSDAYL